MDGVSSSLIQIRALIGTAAQFCKVVVVIIENVAGAYHEQSGCAGVWQGERGKLQSCRAGYALRSPHPSAIISLLWLFTYMKCLLWLCTYM